MQVVRDWTAVPRGPVGSWVAIGNFDGVHIGHQAIVRRMVAEARAAGGQTVVMTFDPRPVDLLRPEGAPPLLMSVAEKTSHFAALGVDVHLVVAFDRAFAGLAPEAFVQQVLLDALAARMVTVGFNFFFGTGARGDAALLQRLGDRHGFGVRIVQPVQADGRTVSSTAIRQALAAGQVAEAQNMLGRPYSLTAPVVHGDRIGRTLGYPTVNLDVDPRRQLPGRGVYAVAVGPAGTDGDRSHHQSWGGMANLGRRPTFGSGEVRLEVHLFDFAGDLYGRLLQVHFLARLRAERRFAGAADLIEQLKRDEAAARRLLAGVEP